MLKLRKYLKPFAVSILVIVALLFAQAMCELTMPDYMSNIVNVGINSNGIEDGVLQAVRAQEYEKLALFMSEEEQQIFADNYTLVTPSQASEAQLERYPALADEDVYLLREDAVNTHEEIRQALSQAETYVAGIDQMEVTLQEAMNDPNKAAELSEEQQQLLQECADEALAYNLEAAEQEDTDDIAELEAMEGVTVTRWSDETFDEVQAIVEPIVLEDFKSTIDEETYNYLMEASEALRDAE